MSGHPVEPTKVISRHHVAHEVIEQVFAGPVGESTVAVLRDGQRSRRLLLLKLLREEAVSLPPADGYQGVEDPWRILVVAEKRAPDVVGQILSYPSVGTWLVRAIRKIRGIINDDVPTWVDMGYLNSIAAAAAIRVGIDVEVSVPAWRGRITLPTLGQFAVADEESTRMARLRVRDSTPFFESGEGTWIPLDEARTFPLRLHRSTAGGHTVCWTVDDIDPYRTFVDVEEPNRLAPTEFEALCGRLDDAWAILVEEHPEHVREVSAVEPVLAPVVPGGGFVASSSASAFGAVCMATPDAPQVLAETLVHELQHSKLNALLDLVPLQRPGSDRLCYAPWRRDPRPLSGLLHGIYAFVGVVEYWHRRLRSGADADDPAASFQFANRRAQMHEALRWLGPAPELSAAGTRFLEVASARLKACDEVVVEESLSDVVTMLSAESRLVWQLRHLVPPAEHIERLAALWLDDEPVSSQVVEPELRPFHREVPESSLSRLLTDRAPVDEGLGQHGELALVRSEFAAAKSAFAERLRTDPDDDRAWVGLLLALSGHGEPRPPALETVAAVHRRIRASSGLSPDPVTLVDWFADC